MNHIRHNPAYLAYFVQSDVFLFAAARSVSACFPLCFRLVSVPGRDPEWACGDKWPSHNTRPTRRLRGQYVDLHQEENVAHGASTYTRAPLEKISPFCKHPPLE